MATVPGTPMRDLTGGIPRELQPTQADMLMAAAIMHQQGQFIQPQQPPSTRSPDVVQTPSGRYKSMGRSGAYEKDMDYRSKIDER